MSMKTQLLVLGGGPGGYSAAFRAADLGLEVTIVERYPVLGGVCLNVGCIPSKALLHVAAVIDEARHLDRAGITFGAPQIDLDRLRNYKAQVVRKLNQGLAGMAKARKVNHIQGIGKLTGPSTLAIERTEGPNGRPTGETLTLTFEQAILAAGSEPIRLPFQPQDPRVVEIGRAHV